MQPKCRFLSAIFAISDLQLRVPNFIQIKLLPVLCSVIFGLGIRFAQGTFRAPPPLTIYKIYYTVAKRLPKTTRTLI